MKNYQDTETGKIWAFDDGVDPFKLNNRNIPTTLSETVIPKPSDSHVWFNGNWISDTEAPKGYKPPISSVPSYNPAWMAFLSPYTVILRNAEDKYEISLDEINSNSYDGDKLSKAVATLSLSNAQNANALVSFDGAISIPMNEHYSSRNIALDNINRIFCALLIGGIHAEVVTNKELLSGCLHDKENLFAYIPTLHGSLRHKSASITDRIILRHPRILRVSELTEAYLHGAPVIEAIQNFSPFFLLHGYSAMIHQNRSDALSSLWIVVEQLTWSLWDGKFLNSSEFNPPNMKSRIDSLKQDNRTWSTSVKHELLWQTKIISADCLSALSAARKQRNELVHKGRIPDFSVIHNLWECLYELFEIASGIRPIKMRRLVPIEIPIQKSPENTNFDEWCELSMKLSG